MIAAAFMCWLKRLIEYELSCARIQLLGAESDKEMADAQIAMLNQKVSRLELRKQEDIQRNTNQDRNPNVVQ